MIALLVGLSLLNQSVAKPDIFIYFEPGMKAVPVESEPWIAIWRSGRIMWRDTEPVWGLRKGVWGLPPAKYFESEVDPKLVELALLEIGKVAKDKRWYFAIPDSHMTRAEIRLPGRVVEMGVTDEPKVKPEGWTEKQWLGKRAWETTIRSAKALIPAKTNPLPRRVWIKSLKMAGF